MKMLLIRKKIEICAQCPCRHYEGEETDVERCGVTQEVIAEGNGIPKTCPLKDLPERISSENVPVDFANGWNSAIDQIELG